MSWQPPWPPIRIGPGEWILMRDSRREPAAVVRHLQLGPRREWFFRVVTWAESSEGRELVGYYRTLDEADQSVKFQPPVLTARSGPPNGGGVTHAGARGRGGDARPPQRTPTQQRAAPRAAAAPGPAATPNDGRAGPPRR